MVEQSERVSCPLRSRAWLSVLQTVWTTVAHVVFGLWAKHEGERGYKTQKLKWNRVLKTMKTVTAVTFCAFHTLFFDLWSFCAVLLFPLNSATAPCSFLAHLSTNQHLAVAYVIWFQRDAVRILEDCTAVLLAWVKTGFPSLTENCIQRDIFARL